jgi:hypothetical protein
MSSLSILISKSVFLAFWQTADFGMRTGAIPIKITNLETKASVISQLKKKWWASHQLAKNTSGQHIFPSPN